jgi:hypothetical protein
MDFAKREGGGVLIIESVSSMVSAPSTDGLVDKKSDTGSWKYANHVWCHALVESQNTLRPKMNTRQGISRLLIPKNTNQRSLVHSCMCVCVCVLPLDLADAIYDACVDDFTVLVVHHLQS